MSIRKKMQELKRELILEEAGKLFVLDGYEAMKIADLAKIVGVSVGTIYTLFGSKENLYTNYLISQIEHYSDVIHNELTRLDDPIEKLHKLVEIKYGAMIKNQNAMRQSIVNDPTFFMNNTDEEHPLMLMFHFIADNVMQALNEQIGSQKNPMQMVFLFEGLAIGYIKCSIVCGDDLMAYKDETVTKFLKLIEEE